MNMAVSILQEWNDPDYLIETGADNGWSSSWCRLCGIRGSLVTKLIDNSTIRGIRDPWVCDECLNNEVCKNKEISNGRNDIME